MPDTATTALPRRHLEMLALFEELGPDTHLSAADVYERLRTRIPGVGLATVHRGLARLALAGRLMCVELPGSQASVYELGGAPHAHFVCDGCRSIQDISYEFPADQIEKLSASVKGAINTTVLSLRGFCAACSTVN